MTGCEEVPDEGSHLLHHHEPSSRQLHEDVPYYAPPRQRQRWDDAQVLPHVNWGDLYWDLFYVSGAFNLAAALKESLSFLGFFYFATCYLALVAIWIDKTIYDARFAPADNLYHRFLEVVHILVLGFVVQHIRPLSMMQDTDNDPATFCFTVALAVEAMLTLNRYVDVKRNVKGGPEAKHDAASDVRRRIVALIVFSAAAVVAGVDYLGPSDGTSSSAVENDDGAHSDGEVADVHWTNHIPMMLCLLGYFSCNMAGLVEFFCCTTQYTGTHKDFKVPVNIEFMLHRFGEWVMLMLGESVLALLIVEQSSGLRYYVTFFAGILSVTLFQYLFFRSQPFEADDHALRRSPGAGFSYLWAVKLYSASLILVGCSYKMILHYFLEEEELIEEHGESALQDEEISLELEHTRKQIARLFCYSMALSFIALDLMIILHRGFVANFSRFRVNGKWAWGPLRVSVLVYVLLFITVDMWRWFDRLETLAAAGLMIVIAQVLIRTRGLRYFPVSKRAMELAQCGGDLSLLTPDEGGSHTHHSPPGWPNRTQPQSIPIS